MALNATVRQLLSDMHDEASAAPDTTVVRDVTLGANTWRLKMVVKADGEINLRARKL